MRPNFENSINVHRKLLVAFPFGDHLEMDLIFQNSEIHFDKINWKCLSIIIKAKHVTIELLLLFLLLQFVHATKISRHIKLYENPKL